MALRDPHFSWRTVWAEASSISQPVKHLESDHPLYGMQARGIDGVDQPLDRIEDMAEFHLNVIRSVQPQGPYALIGYSLGGLVVLEMAQQLSANGEKVALLAMLDAYPHMRHLAWGQRVRLAVRQARRGLHFFGNSRGSALYQPPLDVPLTPAMQAGSRERISRFDPLSPGDYRGVIKFVRAEVSSGFPVDAAAVWAPFAENVEVVTVPGDHLGMIATHYESLAAVLSQYLTEGFF